MMDCDFAITLRSGIRGAKAGVGLSERGSNCSFQSVGISWAWAQLHHLPRGALRPRKQADPVKRTPCPAPPILPRPRPTVRPAAGSRHTAWP